MSWIEGQLAHLAFDRAMARKGHEEWIAKAIKYRILYGSPAENLSKLLDGKLTGEERQEIIEEPYG